MDQRRGSSRLIYSNKYLILCSSFSVSPDRVRLHFVVNMTKYISNISREVRIIRSSVPLGCVYVKTLLSHFFFAPSDCDDAF